MPGTQITMQVRDWLIIDATIDNTIAMEAVGGDTNVVQLGRGIRQAGGAQARRHPRKADGWGSWPPLDDYLEITLDPSTWVFIVEQLRRWAAVANRIPTTPGGDLMSGGRGADPMERRESSRIRSSAI
ncbi:hypothetical protein ACX3O0_06785 [Homoserinimonas sp. A447]